MAKRRPSGDGMVRQRNDGRWEGRIVVGHQANGAPIFRYMSAKTQKDLMEKLHRSIEEYDGADLTEDSRMTLGEWLDIWLEECAKPSVRPTTFKGYQGYIERTIKPYLGSKQISKVTTSEIQSLYRKLQKEGGVDWRTSVGEHRAANTQCPAPSSGCGCESTSHREESQ